MRIVHAFCHGCHLIELKPAVWRVCENGSAWQRRRRAMRSARHIRIATTLRPRSHDRRTHETPRDADILGKSENCEHAGCRCHNQPESFVRRMTVATCNLHDNFIENQGQVFDSVRNFSRIHNLTVAQLATSSVANELSAVDFSGDDIFEPIAYPGTTNS